MKKKIAVIMVIIISIMSISLNVFAQDTDLSTSALQTLNNIQLRTLEELTMTYLQHETDYLSSNIILAKEYVLPSNYDSFYPSSY